MYINLGIYFSRSQAVDTSKLLNSHGPAIENDRLQVHPVPIYPLQRKGSFLYRPESDNENGTPRSSRNSSISNEGLVFNLF